MTALQPRPTRYPSWPDDPVCGQRTQHTAGNAQNASAGQNRDDCFAHSDTRRMPTGIFAPVFQVFVGEQDGVIYRSAKLYRIDDQVCDIIQPFSR